MARAPSRQERPCEDERSSLHKRQRLRGKQTVAPPASTTSSAESAAKKRPVIGADADSPADKSPRGPCVGSGSPSLGAPPLPPSSSSTCGAPSQLPPSSESSNTGGAASSSVGIPSAPSPGRPATDPERVDVPSGLKNLGNSCFVNASLQALFSLPGLRQLAAGACQGVDESSLTGAPAGDATMLYRFGLTLRHSLSTREPFVPTLFTDIFYHGNQADAQEFLLDSVLSKASGAALHGHLEGLEQVRLTCGSCGAQAAGLAEPFMMLHLPLASAFVNSAQIALTAYLAPAHVPWACEVCLPLGLRSDLSDTQQVILRTPSALVLHLVRWGGAGHMVPHFVLPDLELLMLGRRYFLCGVVCHNGNSARCGHYVAFALHGEQWWFYNDG